MPSQMGLPWQQAEKLWPILRDEVDDEGVALTLQGSGALIVATSSVTVELPPDGGEPVNLRDEED